jgi:hypothetical protein
MSGGWARSGDARRVHPLAADGQKPQKILVSDMPASKPEIAPRKRIKGVPGVTTPDPDYLPGHGTWRPV